VLGPTSRGNGEADSFERESSLWSRVRARRGVCWSPRAQLASRGFRGAMEVQFCYPLVSRKNWEERPGGQVGAWERSELGTCKAVSVASASLLAGGCLLQQACSRGLVGPGVSHGTSPGRDPPVDRVRALARAHAFPRVDRCRQADYGYSGKAGCFRDRDASRGNRSKPGGRGLW